MIKTRTRPPLILVILWCGLAIATWTAACVVAGRFIWTW